MLPESTNTNVGYKVAISIVRGLTLEWGWRRQKNCETAHLRVDGLNYRCRRLDNFDVAPDQEPPRTNRQTKDDAEN